MSKKPAPMRFLLDVYASNDETKNPAVAILTLDDAQVQSLCAAERAFRAANTYEVEVHELVIEPKNLVFVARAERGALDLHQQLPGPLLRRFVREGFLQLPDDFKVKYPEADIMLPRLVVCAESFYARARAQTTYAHLHTREVPISVLDALEPPEGR